MNKNWFFTEEKELVDLNKFVRFHVFDNVTYSGDVGYEVYGVIEEDWDIVLGQFNDERNAYAYLDRLRSILMNCETRESRYEIL